MKKVNLTNLIISFFLSISLNIKIIINKGLKYFIKEFHLDILFLLKVIIIGIIIYIILQLLFKLLDKIKLKNKKIEITKKYKLLIFIAIFIPAFIYLIVYYPAVYLNDTVYVLFNPISRSCYQPLFYGIVMSITFFSLKIFFSTVTSIFIMSIIQIIISSIIITELIVWFNKKIKNKYLTIILFIYYFLTPIVANYNVSLNKDTPYSLMMVVFFTLIYEFVETKGKILSEKKYFIKLLIVSIIILFLRSNGLFVIIPSLIIIFMVYRLKKHKTKYISIIILLLVFNIIQTTTTKLIGIEYLRREMYSVPIQQISYLVKYHPNALTKDDYKLLSKIINNPKKQISMNYNEFEVDSIKYDTDFNDLEFNKHEKDFIVMWIKKIPSNFSSYTKSYLLNSYHLWSIDKLKKEQSIFDVAYIDVDKEDYIIYNKKILPNRMQNLMISYYKIFNTYLNPAGCFILLLITISYAIHKRKKIVVLLSTPLITTWIVLMISSPMSSALRYMAAYIYLLPVIMLYTFKITRKNNQNRR